MYHAMEKEFRIIKTLDSNPSFIQGQDYFADNLHKRGYLVMEEAQGQNVLDLIVNEGPLAEQRALEIIKKVLEAIDFMHKNRVVHRDFNPSNVFLSDESMIKIIDFNVSQIIESDKHFIESGTSKFKYTLFTKTGTPLYSAPELHSASRYTEAIDIWGAGVVLYLILCGECPFTERNLPVLIKQVTSGAYSFKQPAWEMVSKEAIEFVKLLLSVDPDQRPTAEEALKHSWFNKIF